MWSGNEVQQIVDSRGDLFVIEDFRIPFQIKRVYFIRPVKGIMRGRHAHRKTRQFLISLSGSCQVFIKADSGSTCFILDDPSRGLLLEPDHWHEFSALTENCIILVLASENFDSTDYIMD